MAYTVELQTVTDDAGSLTVIEKEIPFDIKRVYYVYDVPGEASRGGHRHLREKSALICLNGSCVVNVFSPAQCFVLDRPNLCLVLCPNDWHQITNLSQHAILLVLCSEPYNPADYILEKPT